LAENLADLGGEGEIILMQQPGPQPFSERWFCSIICLQNVERGHGIFLNAVEERATPLFLVVISRETQKPLFLFLCISTHVLAWIRTDTCVCEEMCLGCKDLRGRS